MKSYWEIRSLFEKHGIPFTSHEAGRSESRYLTAHFPDSDFRIRFSTHAARKQQPWALPLHANVTSESDVCAVLAAIKEKIGEDVD